MLPRVNKHLGASLLCVAALLTAGSARADDPLPQPAAPKRYDSLAAHSPFAPPTGPAPAPVAAPTPPPGPSWSDNLVVTSIMQNGNDYTATVMEKDTSARYLVRSGVKREDNQMELATVTWADKPEAIKVTVRKGSQLGDVRFDASATGTSGPAPGIPPGRVPAPPVNFHPPPGVPGSVPNPPGGPPSNIVRGRPVIRANPPPIPGGQAARPVVTAPNPIVRAPAKSGGDDDDDDD